MFIWSNFVILKPHHPCFNSKAINFINPVTPICMVKTFLIISVTGVYLVLLRHQCDLATCLQGSFLYSRRHSTSKLTISSPPEYLVHTWNTSTLLSYTISKLWQPTLALLFMWCSPVLNKISLLSLFNPLSANPTKWSNTLKQFVGNSGPFFGVGVGA